MFVDNDATDVATIVEVRAADGIGVLARITDVFAPHGVRVDQAYVSTLGHEVVDTFYVTRADGAEAHRPGGDRRPGAGIGPAAHAVSFRSWC